MGNCPDLGPAVCGTVINLHNRIAVLEAGNAALQSEIAEALAEVERLREFKEKMHSYYIDIQNKARRLAELEAEVKLLQQELAEARAEVERITRCYNSIRYGTCYEGTIARVECKQMRAMRAEVERLRGLVKTAYLEGLETPHCEPSYQLWEISRCRQALEEK